MMPDYYSILGVPPDAGGDEIKKAYRECARKYHPDLGGSHERMLLVNEAFAVLSDPLARRWYDQTRQRGREYYDEGSAGSAASGEETGLRSALWQYGGFMLFWLCCRQAVALLEHHQWSDEFVTLLLAGWLVFQWCRRARRAVRL